MSGFQTVVRSLTSQLWSFSPGGGSKTYMPKKVTNTQRIINNVILKIVNIVVSRGAVSPLPHIHLST
jgi:hypothetical protein